MVDTYEGRKASVGEDRQFALTTSGSTRFRGYQRSTSIYAAQRSLGIRDGDVGMMMMMMMMMMMKALSKIKGKTNFSRHLQAVQNLDCWIFENHWRSVQSEILWCRDRPKMFFFIFGRKWKYRQKWNCFLGRRNENESHLCAETTCAQSRPTRTVWTTTKLRAGHDCAHLVSAQIAIQAEAWRGRRLG